MKYFVVETVNAGKVVTGSRERNVLCVLPIVSRHAGKQPQSIRNMHNKAQGKGMSRGCCLAGRCCAGWCMVACGTSLQRAYPANSAYIFRQELTRPKRGKFAAARPFPHTTRTSATRQVVYVLRGRPEVSTVRYARDFPATTAALQHNVHVQSVRRTGEGVRGKT